MFLETAVQQALNHHAGGYPVEGIIWDYDDAYNPDTDQEMAPDEFEWFRVEFNLENIGDDDFRTHMVHWIERQVDFDSTTKDEPDSWEAIWNELEKGEDIHTPVQIALAYQPCYENERLFIADGWHRISLYLRAGRSTIPAIVGIPKPSLVD